MTSDTWMITWGSRIPRVQIHGFMASLRTLTRDHLRAEAAILNMLSDISYIDSIDLEQKIARKEIWS